MRSISRKLHESRVIGQPKGMEIGLSRKENRDGSSRVLLRSMMLSTLELERRNKLEDEYIGEDKMKNTEGDFWSR